MSSWRVGRKLGRTLYRDEVCVGMVDTPLIAAEIVEQMNGEARCQKLEEALRGIADEAEQVWGLVSDYERDDSLEAAIIRARTALQNTKPAPRCTCGRPIEGGWHTTDCPYGQEDTDGR